MLNRSDCTKDLDYSFTGRWTLGKQENRFLLNIGMMNYKFTSAQYGCSKKLVIDRQIQYSQLSAVKPKPIKVITLANH